MEFVYYEILFYIDFGLSSPYMKRSPLGNTQVPVQLHTQCGSPAYAAPEVLAHEPYCNEADIWSLCAILYYRRHDFRFINSLLDR